MFQQMRRLLRNAQFARTTYDQAGVTALLFAAQLSLWYELFHVLPYYEQNSMVTVAMGAEGWWESVRLIVHHSVAITLYVGSFCNLYKLITTKVVCDITQEAGKGAQNYCHQCAIYQPPRSHHCPACDVCVLVRDHHCWFAGTCIGHSNQRYYVSMVMNLFVAALYSNIYHYRYTVETLGSLEWAIPICLFAPHLCAVFGWVSLYQFLICVLTLIGLLLLILFGWLLAIQVIQISKGQTRYELKKGTGDAYDQGLVANWKEVMGERWYIAWLSPWIQSPLPGNGVSFRVTGEKVK